MEEISHDGRNIAIEEISLDSGSINYPNNFRLSMKRRTSINFIRNPKHHVLYCLKF